MPPWNTASAARPMRASFRCWRRLASSRRRSPRRAPPNRQPSKLMSEPTSPNPALSEVEDLRDECAALRWQTTNLLLALLILSGTLNVYLFVQARRARFDLAAVRPQINQVIEQH